MTQEEMNNLAAEKIMGWHKGSPNTIASIHVSGLRFYEYGYYWYDAEHNPQSSIEVMNGDDIGVWNPTNDVTQAIMLLDKVEAIQYQITKLSTGDWVCSFALRPEKEIHQMWVLPVAHTATAPTREEAITRACLKAVGIDLKQ